MKATCNSNDFTSDHNPLLTKCMWTEAFTYFPSAYINTGNATETWESDSVSGLH